MDQTQIQRNTQASTTGPTCSINWLVIIPLLLVALTIAHIAIGAAYLHECPLQPYIPVYVLVCGVFTVVLALLSCLSCLSFAEMMTEEEGQTISFGRIFTVLVILVLIFLFCWIICGSAWIYSIYPPNYNQTVGGEPYCNKTLYLFAFWTTTLGYILLGLALLFGYCLCACFCKHCGPF